jgi:hypothetical protein
MKHVVWVVLAACGLVSTVQATDLKVTCTPATKYDDGATIPTSAVSSFSLYGGLQGQPKVKLVPNASSCSFTRTSVAVGTQEYYVTQTTGGIESVPSTVVSYVVTPPVPGAPSGVTVTVSVTITTP